MVSGAEADDSPKPRASIVRQRNSAPRALVCGAHIVRFSGKAWRNTTGSPCPKSSYAIRAPSTDAITAGSRSLSLRVWPLRQHLAPRVRHTHRPAVVADRDEDDV